jgi:radical SAM superfamily enzyme YgiQ (UPF0313 family)
MKIQLVSATYNAAFSYMRKFLGLGYVQAYAQAHPDVARDVEFQHDFYDTYEETPEEIAEKILRVDADVVAFATYTWNVRDILKIARLVKETAADAKILLGGPEVSYHYQRYLEENPWIDYISAGEGEHTFRGLLLHLLQNPTAAPDQVSGMAFRHAGEIGFAPPREFYGTLDDFPSPFLTGALELDTLLHSAYFQTTRGCPFTCTYCDYGRNQPYYEFSLERVRDELRYFKKHNAKALFAVDATFNYRRGRANEILKMVAEEGLEAMFAIEVFPSLIDDEMVEILKQVKFAHVGIGIQTANPVAMRNIRRIWAPRRIQDKIEKLAEMENVIVSLELIMGLPGDNLQAFRDTLDWSYDRKPHHIFALPLQILSRTPLENQVEQYKIEHSGAESSNEILSCYSFDREEVMVGKAICNWHRLLQPVAFRLQHLLGVKPSEFIENWARHAYYQGLHERVHELHKNIVPDDLLAKLLEEFRGFARSACERTGASDLSAHITELLRYLFVRRSISREGAFFVDVLDVSCITTEEKFHRVYSAVAADLPAPNGLDSSIRLARTGETRRVSFDFDMQRVYQVLDAKELAAVPVEETEYVFFRDPDTGAGRAVQVDDFSRRFIDSLQQDRSLGEVAASLEDAGGSSNSVAQVLLGCGLLEKVVEQKEPAPVA